MAYHKKDLFFVYTKFNVDVSVGMIFQEALLQAMTQRPKYFSLCGSVIFWFWDHFWYHLAKTLGEERKRKVVKILNNLSPSISLNSQVTDLNAKETEEGEVAHGYK